ncbi:phage tail tape measure protein [Pseudobacteriovorax antillogorgiicola]|nr:phage tail tape measure protein [Pseudobacteriovorax antillogorgiicola]TCS51648.1 TP901 family phage tail tape measure protein [Pseudobacteriovorax antillogorgiicola]
MSKNRKKVSIAIAAMFDRSFSERFGSAENKINALSKTIRAADQSLKKIDAYKAMAKDLADLKGELGEASDALRKSDADLKAKTKATDSARGALKAITAEQRQYKQSLLKETEALKESKAAYRALSKAQKERELVAKKDEQRLNALSASTRRLGLELSREEKALKGVETALRKATSAATGQSSTDKKQAALIAKLTAEKDRHKKAIDLTSKVLVRETRESKSLSRSLGQQQTALEQGKSALKAHSDRMKELSSSAARTKEKILESKNAIQRHRATLREHNKSLGSAKKAQAAATQAFDRTNSKVKKQEEALEETSTALRKNFVDTRNLADEQRKLQAVLDKTKRRYKLLAKEKRLSEKADEIGSKISSGATSIAAQSVSLGVSLVPAISFEDKMANVAAVTSADEKQMASFKTKIEELTRSKAALFRAGEIADAGAFLGMAGFSPEKINASIKGVLDLAAAGRMELAQTAEISSNILSGFSLPAEEMARAANTLSATMTSSNVDLEMLGETMKYVAPIGSTVSASLEEVAAAAGLLGDVGIQGSMAGTALRAMTTRLAAPPKMAREALDMLGVTAKDLVTGDLRPMADVLQDIFKKTEDMGDGAKLGYIKKIFGEEAAAGASELIKQAGRGQLQEKIAVLELAPAYRQLIRELKNLGPELADAMTIDQGASGKKLISGFIEGLRGLNRKQLEKRLSKLGITDQGAIVKLTSRFEGEGFDDFLGELDKVKSAEDLAIERNGKTSLALKRVGVAASETAIAIGSVFLPAIAEIASKIADTALDLTRFVEKNTELVRALGIGAAAFLSARTAALAYEIVKLGLKKAIQGATIAQRIFNAASRANIFGAIITGIVLVISYWDELSEMIDKIAEQLKEFWNENIELINSVANKLLDLAQFIPGGALPSICLVLTKESILEFPT